VLALRIILVPTEPTPASTDLVGEEGDAVSAGADVAIQMVSEVHIVDEGINSANHDEAVVFAAYRALETLQQHGWEESRHRFKDYVRAPKPNGYPINCKRRGVSFFFPANLSLFLGTT